MVSLIESVGLNGGVVYKEAYESLMENCRERRGKAFYTPLRDTNLDCFFWIFLKFYNEYKPRSLRTRQKRILGSPDARRNRSENWLGVASYRVSWLHCIDRASNSGFPRLEYGSNLSLYRIRSWVVYFRQLCSANIFVRSARWEGGQIVLCQNCPMNWK